MIFHITKVKIRDQREPLMLFQRTRVQFPALTSCALPAILLPASPVPFFDLSNLFTHGGHTQTNKYTHVYGK